MPHIQTLRDKSLKLLYEKHWLRSKQALVRSNRFNPQYKEFWWQGLGICLNNTVGWRMKIID